MAGTLQGFLAESGTPEKTIARGQAALRRMGAAQHSREQAAMKKLRQVRARTPAFLAGDPLARMDLATMGVTTPPKTDEEIAREDTERAWQHQKDLDRMSLAKEQEKRMVVQHKERMEAAKANAEAVRRRDEERTKESDRRFDLLTEQRETARLRGVREKAVGEFAQSDKEYAEYKANLVAWEPLAKEMFPDMSEAERAEQIDSLARKRGPSISEQAIPRARAEQRKAEEKKEAAIDTLLRKQFPAPELPDVPLPKKPKPVTEKQVLAEARTRDTRAREQREKEIRELPEEVVGFGIRKPGELERPIIGHKEVRHAFGVTKEPIYGDVPALVSREQRLKENPELLARMVEEGNAENAEAFQAQIANAQQKQEANWQALMKYNQKLEEKKGVMRTVPGALGMALAGVGQQKETPEQKGQASFRQSQEKERLQFDADVAKARKQAAAGNAKAQQTLENLKAQGLIE